jgi:lipopolysaccharide export LptBFGC system permease protein LptF
MSAHVEPETTPLPVPQEPRGGDAPRRRARFWPEVSGALAIGLCALAVAMLGFQVLAWFQGMPGPGLLTVGGHLLAAVLAVLVQRFADRLRGTLLAAAVLGVLVLTGATLWIFWWA